MERAFKGIWLPAEIWLDKSLNIIEKCMLAEIDSLDGESGCYATNEYFAEFFGISTRQVQRVIAKLVELKYITTSGSPKRVIRVVYHDKNVTYRDKNVVLNHDKNVTHITYIDNKIKNNICDFVERWNSTSLPKIQKMTDKRKAAFRSRVNEYGYENVIANFEKACRSDFLMGHVKDYTMNVDFFLNPNRYVDIMEGKYNRDEKFEEEVSDEWQ